MKKILGTFGVVLLLGFFGLLLLLGGMGAGLVAASSAQGCPAPGSAVSVGKIPGGVVAGYSGAQLVGAAQIMQAGKDKGVDVLGQTIGVMVSMGESGLTPVNHGDLAGPNSLGWFQQRDWGSRADEMDPYRSATMFFAGGRHGEPGLLSVPGWELMQPTIAAHRVQRNADPYYYTQFWDPAVAVVQALSGVPVTVTPGTGDQTCTSQPPGSVPVGPGGWIRPVTGPITSGYGPRWGGMHYGQDFGAPCSTPTYAAHDGAVILVALGNKPPATGYGTLVGVDVGGGVVIRYAHAYNNDVLVHVGQQVKAGDQLTRVGTYGDSTGCHLHFEILVDGKFTDPAPFLTARGVVL